MENIKTIEWAIVAAILFIPMAILGINFFKKKAVALKDAQPFILDQDEHTYYLKHAPRGQFFELFTTQGTKLDYTLVNGKGNKIRPVIKKTGDHTYLLKAPIFGYTNGERYILSLGSDVFFQDKSLENADSLIFSIEKETVEMARLNVEVIDVDELIVQVDDDRIEIKNFTGDPGDLVYGFNENGLQVAYKIKEVNEDGSFIFTFPAVEEIYSALAVYGKYPLDFKDLVPNPALETEIVNRIKDSEFYSSLAMKAYGKADNKNINILVEIIENKETAAFSFKIGFEIKPNKNGLFGDTTFTAHKVKLTLKGEIDVQVDLDIQDLLNWDISTTQVENLHWNIEIAVLNQKDSPLSEIIAIDRKEDVKTIVQALNEITADEANSTIELFNHQLLIPEIPGFRVTTTIQLDLQFIFKANVLFNTEYTTSSTTGLSFANQEYRPYYSFSHEDKDGISSIKGDIKSQVGLLFNFNLLLFHEEIAHVLLQPALGVYIDGYSAITLSDLTSVQEQIYGYFEAGLYFNTLMESHLKTTTQDHKFTHEIAEKRQPSEDLVFGESEVIMGITASNTLISSNAGLATPPALTLEYYDVRSGDDEQEILAIEDLTFLFKKRNELEIQDGILVLPETKREKIEISAQYEHDNGHIFKAKFEVEIPENKKVNLADHPKFKDSVKLIFSNDKDAWATTIILKPNGSFIGESYSLEGKIANPSAIHRNEFTGLFEKIKVIDENSYSMKLSNIIYAKSIGKKWTENQKPYTASKAFGLEGSKDFILYTPDQETAHLSADFLTWNTSADGYSSAQLMEWGLHNMETNEGFFGY